MQAVRKCQPGEGWDSMAGELGDRFLGDLSQQAVLCSPEHLGAFSSKSLMLFRPSNVLQGMLQFSSILLPMVLMG